MAIKLIANRDRTVENLAADLGSYLDSLGTGRYHKGLYRNLHRSAMAFKEYTHNLYATAQRAK